MKITTSAGTTPFAKTRTAAKAPTACAGVATLPQKHRSKSAKVCLSHTVCSIRVLYQLSLILKSKVIFVDVTWFNFYNQISMSARI